MPKQILDKICSIPIENYFGKIYNTKHKRIYLAWVDFCKNLPASDKYKVRIHGGFVRDTLAKKYNKVKDIDFIIEDEKIAKQFFDFLNDHKLVNPRSFGSKNQSMKEGYVNVQRWSSDIDVVYATDNSCMDCDINNIQIWFDALGNMQLSTEFETIGGIVGAITTYSGFQINKNYNKNGNASSSKEILEYRIEKLLAKGYSKAIGKFETEFGNKFSDWNSHINFNFTSTETSTEPKETIMNKYINRAQQAGFNMGARASASFIKTAIVDILRAVLAEELGDKTETVISSVKIILDTKIGEALISFVLSVGADNIPWKVIRENASFAGFADALGTNSFDLTYQVIFSHAKKLIPVVKNLISSLAKLPIPGIMSAKEQLRIATETLDNLKEEEIAEKIMAYASQTKFETVAKAV